MLRSRRSQYIFYFSCFMVVFYVGGGIMLSATNIYKFQNQVMIGIALIVYGIFRAARIWNMKREEEID